MKPTRKHESAIPEGTRIHSSSLVLSCPSVIADLFPAWRCCSMCRDCARSWPRSRAKITISEKQTDEIRHTTTTFADNATRELPVLAEEMLDDASSATAMPEAVMMVLAASTYISRLS